MTSKAHPGRIPGQTPRFTHAHRPQQTIPRFGVFLKCTQRNFSATPHLQRQAPDHESFYRYTSGRWLWDEEPRLQERYKKFNVPGLKHIAAKAMGAKTCLSIAKLAEGGYNKVFRLCMDDGRVVIARIPNPNVGPMVAKVLASEVATMDFVKNVFGIPVPEILAWDGARENEVESEYMLMEQAEGVQLGERKLQSVSFSRCGNLYFRSDAFEGCFEVGMSGDVTSSAKAYAKDRFVIGPVAGSEFWNREGSSIFADRGPWRGAQSYLRTISQRERAKAPRKDNPTASSSSQDFELLDSTQARLSLLDKFDAIIPHLPPSDPILDRATLSHWDLRAPNIFVENGHISSVIDWQDTWISPFFMQERRPQLIEYHGELMLRLPDYYESIEDKNEKARVTDKVEKSLLSWDYGEKIPQRVPALQQLFDMPLAKTRRETVLFASELWGDETIPLRESLLKLQRNWSQLDTGLRCPINFSSAEIEAHKRASADWNDNADLWTSLEGFIARDGYVAAEDYEKALKTFKELREEGRKQFEGDELTQFEELTRWAGERPER